MMHFGEHYVFPLFPLIGTVILLIHLRLAVPALSKVKVIALVLCNIVLHVMFFYGLRQFYNDDIYEYGGYGWGLFWWECGTIAISLHRRCQLDDKKAFATRLGLNLDDTLIEGAFEYLKYEGRNTVQTIADLRRMITKARNIKARKELKETMFHK